MVIRTVSSSIVAGILKLSPSIIFLMTPLRTLPDLVLGSLSTMTTFLNAATGPYYI